MKKKSEITCVACMKNPLSKDEIGINIKLMGNTENVYCIECLADVLDVTPQDIIDKIEEFKEEGCTLFH